MPALDPHRRFLVQCLAGAAPSIPTEQGWSWEKFIEAASGESLLPAMYGLLQNSGLRRQAPGEIVDFFFAARELNRVRNTEILERIRIVAAALNEVGVEPVLLKGAAYLLADVYSDPGDRFLVDIDFLVARQEIPKSLGVLGQLGYTFERVDPIDHATNHTYAVLSRSDSMTIDLHQTLGLGPSSLVLPASELIRRSVVNALGEARVRIPSPTDLMTHHILHSQVHELYRDRIWTPIRSLYDLKLIQQRFGSDLDWNLIVERFARKRLYGELVLYLKLAERTLQLRPPFSFRMGVLLGARWQHRQLLRRFPAVRFFDPFWFYSAGVVPRTRRLRSILDQPGGLRYLLKKLFTVDFFLRLKGDVS